MHKRTQTGIAYVGLLLMVAVVGIVAGAAADVYQLSRQRSRETELLWIGHQFRAAIASYYEAGEGGNKVYPAGLEDLLNDPRFPVVRRHLRRIYVDPMTGKPDWELIMAPQGGIAGVKSRSVATPVKQANFRPRDEHFSGKNQYAEWEFTVLPVAPPGKPPGPKS